MSIFPPEFIQSIYKSGRSTWTGFVIVIICALIASAIVHRIYGPLTDDRDAISFILILVVLVAGGSLISGFRVYHSRIREAVTDGRHLPDKLNRYRSAIAVFLVICTFPIFIALFGFIITGNYYLFVMIAMCFGSILLKAPSKSKVTSELRLSAREKAELG